MSKLLIVESPSKIKGIKKYLGADYEVMASKGHVRDLPKSRLGVDVEKDFAPQYINMTDKKELIRSLKQAAANCDEVYLATDPDREGEAISWHLAEVLELDKNAVSRIEFNEISEKAVKKADIKNISIKNLPINAFSLTFVICGNFFLIKKSKKIRRSYAYLRRVCGLVLDSIPIK